MNQVTIIIQMFQALPDALKKVCLDCLMGNSTPDSKKFTDLIDLILSHNHTAMGDRPHCAHCHSEHVIKNGHKGETQRYLCKDCGRTFVITNNTILFSTKKKLSTWEKYLECMMYWQERNNGVIISVSNTRKIMLIPSFSASSNMKGVFLCRKEYTLKRQTFGEG